MRTLVLCLVFCSTAAAEIYIVPVVSAKYGDRFYSTTLLLRNPTHARVRCEAVYAIPNDPEGGTLRATYDVAPGAIQIDEEALREAGAIGTLRMACSGPVEVAAQIRTSTDAIAFGAGRVFSGIEESNEIGATSPPWRTSTARDLAVMEVRGERVVILAFIRTAKGDLLAEHSYTIPPFALQIVNLKDFRAADASLELVVIGRGAVVIQTEGDAQSTQSSASIRSRGTGIPPARNALAGLPAAFKAAPFQDPATGLIQLRDRWYDPSTGTFISPDREQYRDSPNLFLFAGGDPVNKSDPTGRYEADFHYGLTYFLALRAGFCDHVARKIAAGAELPDQDRGREPVAQGKTMKSWTASAAEKSEAQDMLWLWHFPKAQRNAGDVIPGSPEARRFVARGVERGSLGLFSQGLHPLQDSWSHRGTPSLDGVAGHPKARGGLLSTKTDQPWRWPVEALAAAQATYDYLVTYRLRHPQQSGNCVQPPRAWSMVASEASTFIQLRRRSDKKAWLLSHGITMPDDYWDDVDDE